MMDKNEDVIINLSKTLIENTNQSTINDISIGNMNKVNDCPSRCNFSNNSPINCIFHENIQDKIQSSTIKENINDYNNSDTYVPSVKNDSIFVRKKRRKKNGENKECHNEKKIKKNKKTNKGKIIYKYRKKNDGPLNDIINGMKTKTLKKTDIIINEEELEKKFDKENKKCKKFKQKNINNYCKSTEDNNNEGINNKELIDKERFVCNFCSKKYTCEKQYQKHLISHNENKFHYETSSKKFELKAKIENEKIEDKLIKEFICPICKSTFNLSYNYKSHLRIHNKEKPYTCTYPGCYAKFIQQNHLISHTKKHNRETKSEEDHRKQIGYHKEIIKLFNGNKSIITKLSILNNMALNDNKKK